MMKDLKWRILTILIRYGQVPIVLSYSLEDRKCEPQVVLSRLNVKEGFGESKPDIIESKGKSSTGYSAIVRAVVHWGTSDEMAGPSLSRRWFGRTLSMSDSPTNRYIVINHKWLHFELTKKSNRSCSALLFRLAKSEREREDEHNSVDVFTYALWQWWSSWMYRRSHWW